MCSREAVIQLRERLDETDALKVAVKRISELEAELAEYRAREAAREYALGEDETDEE